MKPQSDQNSQNGHTPLDLVLRIVVPPPIPCIVFDPMPRG
jgi:hypothetical protein